MSQPPPSQWGAGTVIMSRYRLESLLGRGGMGSVWRAEHLQLRSPVAIKMLDPAIANNEQMLSRFLREAQACAALRSPNVVQIFDYGVDGGTAYIAMEMLQGESLSERIARRGRLAPEEAFRFLAEVLRAIGKAHEAGIVHRDLKPDNVFICRDEPEFAKVLDFGVAKVKNGELGSSGGKTQTGMMIGTPYYMSPEQTQAKEVDARADLWAIAVIAFECLTGQRPFAGESFGELVIAICTNAVPLPSRFAPVPPGFDEWFVRGTQRDRNRRFQSAKEMADELARVASGGARVAITGGLNSKVPFTPALPANSPVPYKVTPALPPGEELKLTTGARAAVSSAQPSVRPSASPAALLLGGVAALIVLGVGAFVAMGGAAAFKSDEPGESATATSALPASAPAPVLPPRLPASATPAGDPPPGPAPATSAAPLSAPAPSASASAEKKVVEPPARAPARVAPAPRPRPARPAIVTEKPPKNWEF